MSESILTDTNGRQYLSPVAPAGTYALLVESNFAALYSLISNGPLPIAPSATAATNVTNINAQLTKYGVAVLGAGVFPINQAIVLSTGQAIVGQGVRISTLQLAPGANDDVIRSVNYSTLAGTTTNWSGTPHSMSVANLTVDGNNANNTAGGGITFYGYDDRFLNVEVFDATGIGFVHAGPANWPENIYTSAGPKSYMLQCSAHHNTGGGVQWAGCSDSVLHGVESYLNGTFSGGTATSTGSTTIGIQITGQGFGIQCVNCHSWGRNQQYAWSCACDVMLVNCKGEGGQAAQLLILTNQSIVYGGKWFADLTGAAYDQNSHCIQIGNTGNAPANCSIDTVVSMADGGGSGTGASIYFANDGGNSTINLVGYQPNGTVFAKGVKNATTRLNINNSSTVPNGVLTDRDRLMRDSRLSGVTNLLANAGFEGSLTGWTENSGAATLTDSSAWSYSGTQSGLVSKTATSTIYPGITSAPGTGGIAVTASTRYCAEIVVNRQGNGALVDVLEIYWYTSAGTGISSSAVNSTATPGEKAIRVSAVAPSNAAFAAVLCFTQTNSGEVFANYYDDVWFYKQVT